MGNIMEGIKVGSDLGTLSFGAPIRLVVKVATKSQVVAHENEEMYDIEETTGKRNKYHEWKEPKWAQK